MSANHEREQAQPIERADEPLPERIGTRYEVAGLLGRGGNAVVYRVRGRGAAPDVALKQLLVTASDRDRRAPLAFEREFHVLAQLRHPSVIEVYDYGVAESGPYYTMELLDGGDLSAQAPLPFRSACQLMLEVCSSLSLLHSRRLLHRDISPRNVRCTRSGVAKLIDFGAMVPMGPCLHGVGTPAFVAPEVVHHLSLDARTDLFSLGATLYFALTGRRAFAARTMAELNEAWRIDPIPAGRLVQGIPPALDELVMSLLRIDPARRPRSAFEVMQRLAVAAGITLVESDEISRAYLSTPTLVGRDAEQRRFRQCVRRATQSDGCALLFEGESGIGRSRLLDVCMLEGKTAGATVLRIDGSTARHEPFASAHRLAEQLRDALPDSARDDLNDPALFRRLFADTGELVAREQLQAEPYSAQAALLAWFRTASQRRLLILAIDDLDRIDDASLALLVTLMLAASGCQLLLVASVAPIDEAAQPALAVLRKHGVALALQPLGATDTEALFTSIFFETPHVAVVSHRIHQLAAGRPREAMALARHLLDTGRIRYADGNWILPAELATADLPPSAEEALRLRVARLTPLARELAEAQALALDDAWTRADYLALDAAVEPERISHALAMLVQEGVVVENGESYALSRLGVRAQLVAELAPAAALQRHLALAARSVHTARPLLFEVHHLLQANQSERALDRLHALLHDGTSALSLTDNSGLSRKTVGTIIELALAVAVERGHRPREINDLRRILVESSPRTDAAVLYRYAPSWLAQLELDSGLCDYLALGDSGAPQARLERALAIANQRYAAQPETGRVYRTDEAIRYLVRYAIAATAVGWRTGDTQLLASVREKLEPFAAISAFAHALWQDSIVLCEVMIEGRLERARTRYLTLLERVENAPGHDGDYSETLRVSYAGALAAIEVVLGYPSARDRIAQAEQSRIRPALAFFLRRALCIFEGDRDGAESWRRQAELAAAQAVSRQVWDEPLPLQLHAQVHAGDIAGVKHVAERAQRLAAEWPGWSAFHHAAHGYFQLLRGDLQTAKHEFEHALELSDPDRVDPPPMLRAWVSAVAGYIRVLTELGEIEAACRFGTRAVDRCEALEISDGYAHIRALAIAEAKLGQYKRAAERLDRLIERRAGMNPAHVAPDWEARALVAIWAKDRNAAAHYAALAVQSSSPDATPLARARRGRLLDEAARAGVALEIPTSGIESVVLGKPSLQPGSISISPERSAALAALADDATRATRVIELVCDAAEANAAELYLCRNGALVRAASRGPDFEPGLERFVQGYFRQQCEQAAMSAIFTATAEASASLSLATWAAPNGKSYSVVLLKPIDRDEYVGAVALFAPRAALCGTAFSALVFGIGARLLELEARGRAEGAER